MKNLRMILIIYVAFMLLFSISKNVFAEEVIDEKWGMPTFVYGSALSESQIQETKSLLGLDSKSIDLKVTGEDMVRLLGSGNPNANMYSSALISGNDNKGGISVEIVTPENITKVSMNQYANALITAGVKDVSVKVVSPVKVTGESALTGVYLAYEDKGYELNQENMNVAQEELSTVVNIVESHSDSETFNEESLNLALIEIKQELSKLKEDNQELTDAIIKNVVSESLKNNNLDSIITDKEVDSLIALASKYVTLDNLMTEEMQEQLTNLAKDVGKRASELTKELGNKVSETLSDEGFWEGIKNFFAKIIDFFANFFVKEETPVEEVIVEEEVVVE